MLKDIYDPLKEYIDVFHDRFKNIAGKTFEKLAAEANVDTEANKETCRQLYIVQREISYASYKLNRLTNLRTVLWVGVIVAAGVIYFNYYEIEPMTLLVAFICIAAAVIILLAYVHPRIKELNGCLDENKRIASQLEAEAWKQMEPLNRLYDWDILTRMMSETVPRLEFDPYFTTQRLEDLRKTYGWDDSFNDKRSVVYSHSGLINGNPFVICRTRKMEMGTKRYTGSKTIYWKTSERGADGKYHSVTHSQVLTATVTAPYPEYYEMTRLIYGNTAAPDLIFYRMKSGLAGRDHSLSFKLKKRKLRNKAKDLSNADFAMMTNEEFEVIFDTSNRNNNQQYALLFTPLAQESMTKLLSDYNNGYGDDFDFVKNRMINTIMSTHMQNINLDMNPAQYCCYDFNKAKRDFYSINTGYFRAIYFCLAPLLCIPMYQQIRPQEDIYGRDMERHSAFWEHEALANFWGDDKFKHPECATRCILKTKKNKGTGGNTTITVYAYGYRKEERVTYVTKWGNDKREHDVPVYWDEYLPVRGHGQISLHEDNDFDEKDITQQERLKHIHDVLGNSKLSVYRRHIASKV